MWWCVLRWCDSFSWLGVNLNAKWLPHNLACSGVVRQQWTCRHRVTWVVQRSLAPSMWPAAATASRKSCISEPMISAGSWWTVTKRRKTWPGEACNSLSLSEGWLKACNSLSLSEGWLKDCDSLSLSEGWLKDCDSLSLSEGWLKDCNSLSLSEVGWRPITPFVRRLAEGL